MLIRPSRLIDFTDGSIGAFLDWVDDLMRGWKNDYPQLELSSLPTLVRLVRLSALIDSFQIDLLEPFELTPSDYGVLASLRGAGRPYALSPSRLQARLRRSSGGMTKILNRLEAAGFIERSPDPEDGRKTRVLLTSRGLALNDRIFRAFAAESSRLLAGLGDRQKTEIDRALKQLHKELEGLEDEVVS